MITNGSQKFSIYDIFIILILTFFLLEVVLRIGAFDQKLTYSLHDANGNELFSRFFSDKQWYDQYIAYSPDDVLGWKQKPNNSFYFHDSHNEYSFAFSTDEFGNRISPYNSGKKTLFLGDSFTFGWGQNDSNIFPNMLGEKLRLNVRNYGQLGYGTDQELLVLKQVIDDEDPDQIILVIFSGNDFENNFVEVPQKNDACIRKTFFTLTENGLVPHSEYIKNCYSFDFVKAAYLVSSQYSVTAKLLFHLYFNLIGKFSSTPQSGAAGLADSQIRITHALLSQIQNVSSDYQVPLYLFVVPSRSLVQNGTSLIDNEEVFIESLKNYSSTHDIFIYDSSEYLKKAYRERGILYHENESIGAHLNAEGNKALAEYMLSILDEDGAR